MKEIRFNDILIDPDITYPKFRAIFNDERIFGKFNAFLRTTMEPVIVDFVVGGGTVETYYFSIIDRNGEIIGEDYISFLAVGDSIEEGMDKAFREAYLKMKP